MSEVDSPDKPLIPRRHFLFGAAATTATALVAAVAPTAVLAESKISTSPPEGASPVENTADKLRAAGLESYINLYSSQKRLFDTFGIVLPYGDIFELVDQIATAPDHNDGSLKDVIARLKDGWGAKEAVTSEEAHAKIDSLNITRILPGTTLKECQQLFHPVADIAPVMIHAIPEGHEIHFNESGGNAGDAVLALTSPQNKKYASVTILHELTHMLDKWENYKEYVPLEKFVEYSTEYTNTVYKAYDRICRSPLKSMHTAQNGHPFFGISYPDETKDTIMPILELWESQYLSESEIANTEGIPEEPFAQNFTYRFNRLAYYTGKKLLEIASKKEKGLMLSNEEKQMKDSINDEFNNLLMLMIIGDTTHFFVGPVQKEEGGLPRSTDKKPSDFLHNLNATLQDTRMWAFSPQGINATQDWIANQFEEENQIETN